MIKRCPLQFYISAYKELPNKDCKKNILSLKKKLKTQNPFDNCRDFKLSKIKLFLQYVLFFGSDRVFMSTYSSDTCFSFFTSLY